MSSASMSNIGAAALTMKDARHQRAVDAYAALYDNKLARETVPSIPDHTPATAKYQPDEAENAWSETCMFRDPLMKVNNLQDYKLQFAGLHSIFKNITLEILGVTVGKGVQDVSQKERNGSEVSELIIIDANCTYFLSWTSVKVRQITRLGLNKDGLIQTHEDMWSWADMIEGIPLIGKAYRAMQPVAGTFVAKMLNANYARKAGVPQKDAYFATNTVHSVYHPIESQRIAAANNSAKAAMQEAEDEASGKTRKRKQGSSQEGKRQHAAENKTQ